MTERGGVYISCGEVSGDGYAAGIIGALRSMGYRGPVYGMMGPLGASAGGEVLARSSELQIMGLSGILSALPRLLKLKNRLQRHVLERSPSVVVVIDSSDFHLPFVAGLRKSGWKGKVVYAVPPAVWAWRSSRVRALARDVDLCLPLFRFEHRFLADRGVSSEWIGHPMMDRFFFPVAPPDEGNRTIAFFPGSRRSEIERLLPPLMSCADALERRGYRPVFSVAPGLSERAREFACRALSGRETFHGEGTRLMEKSRASVGASGTLSVEAMMKDRFLVVLYRFGWFSSMVAKRVIRAPYASIPNMLVGEEVYPEFLLDRATGENALAPMLRYLGDGEYREQVHHALARGRDAMGEEGALAFWADRILALHSGARP